MQQEMEEESTLGMVVQLMFLDGATTRTIQQNTLVEVSLHSKAVLNLLDTTHLRVTRQQKVEVSMHLTVL